MMMAIHSLHLLMQPPIQSYDSLIQRFNEEVENIMKATPNGPEPVGMLQSEEEPVCRLCSEVYFNPYQ